MNDREARSYEWANPHARPWIANCELLRAERDRLRDLLKRANKWLGSAQPAEAAAQETFATLRRDIRKELEEKE